MTKKSEVEPSADRKRRENYNKLVVLDDMRTYAGVSRCTIQWAPPDLQEYALDDAVRHNQLEAEPLLALSDVHEMVRVVLERLDPTVAALEAFATFLNELDEQAISPFPPGWLRGPQPPPDPEDSYDL